MSPRGQAWLGTEVLDALQSAPHQCVPSPTVAATSTDSFTSAALGRTPRRQLTHASDERLRLFRALVASTAGRDLGNRSTRLRRRARSSLQKDI